MAKRNERNAREGGRPSSREKTREAKGDAKKSGRRKAAGSRKAAGAGAGKAAGARKGAGGRKTVGGGARKEPGGRKQASAHKGARKSEARETAAQPVGRPRAARPGTAGRRATSSSARQRRGRTPAPGKDTSAGGAYSDSARRASWIESPEQHAERAGQTLATRDHDVIRQWADERGAVPATISGTEHDGRPGVLRFDFPNFRQGGRLRQVDWDEWFETFDQRRLVFLFQEQMKSGRQSNFFRLDSPDREEA